MICHSIQTPNLKMSLALISVYHLIFPDVKARLSVWPRRAHVPAVPASSLTMWGRASLVL